LREHRYRGEHRCCEDNGANAFHLQTAVGVARVYRLFMLG
jgi:hypothetical protein